MKINLIGSYQDCCPKGYECFDQYHADVIYKLLRNIVADDNDVKIFTVRNEPFNFFARAVSRGELTPDQFTIKVIGLHDTIDNISFSEDGSLLDFPFGFFEPEYYE